MLHEQHKAAEIDNERRDQIGDLGAVHGLIHIRAARRDVLDKERGEHGADGVQSAEEGRGDAVEAHRRDGGGGALPLLISGEVEHRRAHAGERAGDHEAEDDVALFRHAAVFGGILVVAGGLELIAELRLFQHDPHEDRHQHGQRDRETDVLVVVKQRAEPQRVLPHSRCFRKSD